MNFASPMGLLVYTVQNDRGVTFQLDLWEKCHATDRSGKTTLRRQVQNLEVNSREIICELNLEVERREKEVVWTEAYKRMVARQYNTKVKPRHFVKGDLVWRKTNDATKKSAHGKLAPSWEGPYWVLKNLDNGDYHLKYLSEKEIPNTQNATHLKMYYS